MNEPVIDHIQRLERSNRFWKRTSAILAALLLSVTVFGLAFFTFVHQRTLRTMEAVMQHELMMAREAAEVARMQAERALQAAQEAKPK